MTSLKMKPQKPGTVRILWAIDPFDATDNNMATYLQSFDKLQQHIQVHVKPIYFMQAQRYNWSGNYSGDWAEQYRPIAESALHQKFSSISKDYLQSPTVTVEDDPSSIDRHAAENGFDWIAVARNARTKEERFFTGSFTEELIATAQSPLLVFEPGSVACHWNKIFAPVDFAKNSAAEMEQLIDLAGELGASLTLVHKVIHPIEPFVQSGVIALGGGWVSLPSFVEERTKEIQTQVEQWREVALSKKVVLDAVIDSSPITVADLVADLSKDAPDSLIVMATKSGKIRTWLGGSVGRQIVRTSSTTVLIQHITEN